MDGAVYLMRLEKRTVVVDKSSGLPSAPLNKRSSLQSVRPQSHLVDLTECVRETEARRPWSAIVRLPRLRSSALLSSRALKPSDSVRGAYGLCGLVTESLL